ncbi:hypothetical protein SOCE26_011550 [Sorangium cellulosum]|uniref:Uncharacterized protein n=1 Tax=Sorangium cellulosum TaxID=56 RepID=A0A2L0EKD5_SORCE|nr:hypothetical protein [Sorangium cellulosum]AUX39760.1 hypothetical protein SOCE26_011550 [Sorangium cellulosum]
MPRLIALPDAARTPRRKPLAGRRALALPLGVALSGLLAAGTAAAQPAPQRQPPAGSPTQPGGASAQPAGATAPLAAPPPGGAPPAPGGAAAPQPAPPQGPAAAPGAAPGYPPPGYPPPGYQGGYAPYGSAYYPPPPGYYPTPQELPPASPPTPLQRKNKSMMLGGIALTLGGAAAFFTGSGLLASASNRYEIYCDYGGYTSICETRTDEPLQVAGVIVSVAGGLMMAAGIPLWVMGGKKVPAPGEQQPEAPAQVSLSVGPGSTALQMQF